MREAEKENHPCNRKNQADDNLMGFREERSVAMNTLLVLACMTTISLMVNSAKNGSSVQTVIVGNGYTVNA